MGEAELARILLVQACEESDPTGRFLPREERERAASLAAASLAGEDPRAPEAAAEAFLSLRAEPLAAGLVARNASFRRVLQLARLDVPVLAVVAGALLAGLGADALGGQRRVNLLSFPLLGLIGWNLGVYVALGARRLLGGTLAAPAHLGVPDHVARAGTWLVSPERVWNRTRHGEEARWAASSLRRFLGLWRAAAAPLLRARSRRFLHAGAAALALGFVLGMYVRGVAFEYRAGWESTFLDATHVHGLLSAVLGPAARLLEPLAPALVPNPRELLSVESLQRIRSSPNGGEAALWIHLWAITTCGVIVLPRTLLALVASLQIRRVRSALRPDLRDPYALRRLASTRGEGTRVAVLPYSFQPAPRERDALRALALDLFGNHATVSFADPLPYGAGETDAERAAPPSATLDAIVVFGLAQSPEQEVHGPFLEAQKRAVVQRGGGAALLVVLDEEPYRRVVEAARVADRRRAWQRLVRACGLDALALSLPVADGDALLAAAQAALWRPGREEPA